MGRFLRTKVPTHPSLLSCKWPNLEWFWQGEENQKVQQWLTHSISHTGKELPPCEIRSPNLTSQESTVVGTASSPCSYILQTKGEGTIIRHNQWDIVPKLSNERVKTYKLGSHEDAHLPREETKKTSSSTPTPWDYMTTTSGWQSRPPIKLASTKKKKKSICWLY